MLYYITGTDMYLDVYIIMITEIIMVLMVVMYTRASMGNVRYPLDHIFRCFGWVTRQEIKGPW